MNLIGSVFEFPLRRVIWTLGNFGSLFVLKIRIFRESMHFPRFFSRETMRLCGFFQVFFQASPFIFCGFPRFF